MTKKRVGMHIGNICKRARRAEPMGKPRDIKVKPLLGRSWMQNKRINVNRLRDEICKEVLQICRLKPVIRGFMDTYGPQRTVGRAT
jgi:hypothetical protein